MCYVWLFVATRHKKWLIMVYPEHIYSQYFIFFTSFTVTLCPSEQQYKSAIYLTKYFKWSYHTMVISYYWLQALWGWMIKSLVNLANFEQVIFSEIINFGYVTVLTWIIFTELEQIAIVTLMNLGKQIYGQSIGVMSNLQPVTCNLQSVNCNLCFQPVYPLYKQYGKLLICFIYLFIYSFIYLFIYLLILFQFGVNPSSYLH